MTTTPTPIAQAARLLRAAAKDIKDCHTRGDEDWSGEPEALAAHDEHLAVAQALEPFTEADGGRPAGDAVEAFREYLAVHADACTGMGGHAMDDMALDLARIALGFQAPAPALELEAVYSTVRPPSDEDFAQQAALALLTPHAQQLQELAQVAKRLLVLVGAPASAPTDAQLLALNEGERYFSESPSKYPEAGFGTQYHGGAPGVVQFARAVLALGGG